MNQANTEANNNTNKKQQVRIFTPEEFMTARGLKDTNRDLHHLVVYPLMQNLNGKKYWKSRDCKVCKDSGICKLACKYCFTCGLSAACFSQDDGKDCFLSHVKKIVRRNGPRAGLIGV